MFGGYCDQIIKQYQADVKNSTPSLLMTVFGDTVEPHGGNIWLGSLIELVAPLNINQRAVRTSIYRLTRNNWLVGERVGRRSFYRLTESGERSTRQAESRIYYSPIRKWNGEWRLVFTNAPGVNADKRALLRKRLAWLGFGVFAPNVYGHPVAPMRPVWQLLDAMDITDQVVVMRAENFDDKHGPGTREMVRKCWNLDALEKRYRAFIDRYAPLLEFTGKTRTATPEQCFLLRTLLIHQYRRISLRDPQLPAELLPKKWIGHIGYEICRELYRCTYGPAEAYSTGVCDGMGGKFQPATGIYLRRFGGFGLSTRCYCHRSLSE